MCTGFYFAKNTVLGIVQILYERYVYKAFNSEINRKYVMINVTRILKK